MLGAFKHERDRIDALLAQVPTAEQVGADQREK